MFIYLFIFFILAFLSFLEVINLINNIKIKRRIVILVCGIFTVLSTIRWETGTDWISYYSFFQNIGGMEYIKDSQFEIGYTILNILVKSFTNNFTAFLFVGALLIYFLQCNSIIKYSMPSKDSKGYYYDGESSYPLTILFVFWSVYLGNVFFVRSTIAYLILFYSIRFCEKKQFGKFLFCLFIATMFHRTAVAFIFAYWLFNFKFKRHSIIILCVVLVPLGIIFSKNAMVYFSNILGGSYQDKMSTYIDIGLTSAASSYSTFFIILKGIFNIAFLLLLFFTAYEKYKDNIMYRGLLNLYLVGSIYFISTITQSTVLTTLSTPYTMTQTILCTFTLKNINSKSKRGIIFLLIVIYFALRMLTRLYTYGGDMFIPFRTILK